jgi:nucleoid-associated protein YgaU
MQVNMSRKITFLTLFLWLTAVTFPVIAQQNTDTTYTFRFVPQKDMFYVPWNGNDTEFARLLECIENNRTTILDGKLPLYVDGYCNSLGSKTENLATAKIRANRVKSELITRAEIIEENFITRNHANEGDFVTVRLTVPVKETAVKDAEAEARCKAEAEKRAEQERLAEEQRKAEEARLAAEKAEAEKAALQNTLAGTPSETKITNDYHLSLRANLLRWATLTPDLGLEWRICPSWGIAVNGSWTSWSWNDKDRRYALWEVAPEIRYYMGEKKAWYLGAMFKAGQFNYKLSETGKQGDLMGGGITTGYQLRLNKALTLDFNLGLGYLNADFEKYEVIDGVRVRCGNETKDWCGPINAGVTLVWKLF